jgi:S1-C subfamily serine protease
MRGFHNKAGDIVTNNNEDKMASLSSISSYLALVNILSTMVAW